MTAFFTNIWAWITEHAGVIAGIVTPANLILVITTVLQLIRYKKALNANSGASKTLTDSINEISKLKSFTTDLATIKEQLDTLKDDAEQTLTKLNCVLDVQQTAYSVSLAKTATLDAINGIIANGKFAETQSRKAITKEVEQLRAKLETLTAEAKAREEKVKTIAGLADPAQEKCRYD